MVKSVLNNSITFHETKVIDQEDLNYDATQYEMVLGGYNVIIAIGKLTDQAFKTLCVYSLSIPVLI